MGLFGHMRIHESGIHRSLDTPTPPSPTPNQSPCAPTNHSTADIDATDLTTSHSSPSSFSSSITATTTAASASVAHDLTTAEPVTTTGTTPATSIIRREDQDYICPHCDRTFTSRIGLRNRVKIFIARDRKAFEKDLLNRARINPKILYSYIRQRTRNKDPIPLLRTAEGIEISDEKDKAELLSQFFRSIVTNEPDFFSSICEDEETPTLEAVRLRITTGQLGLAPSVAK
nr:unnamed protein product [Spirometra erinaceieuropaei]